MKKLLIIFSAIVFFSCDRENSIPDPTVETLSATVLVDGGVRLFGKIYNFNTASTHGFVISDYEGGTFNMSYNNIMTDYSLVDGEYSIDFGNNLLDGQTYYYNAILYFEDSYLLGEEKSFVSNGSISPIINNVEPLIAHVGDTIIISGEYFSNNFNVYFNEREASLITQTDSLAKAIVPFDYFRDEPYNNLSIKKSTQEVTTFDGFSMYMPEVSSVGPYYAYETDTITIIGNHFNLVNEQNRLSMDVFGNYSNLEIIESSRTEIKFINAGWFYDLFPKMRLKSQFQTIDFNDKFQAKLPTITGAPDCLSYGETATIYGQDFPRVGYNFDSEFSLRIGDVGFSAANIYRDSIVLDVHNGFYNDFILEDVVIEYLGETITYEKDICLDEPWIKVSFDNPQHKPHNYQNETYGVVYQQNSTFLTVGKLNTETYHFESVINEQLPDPVRIGSLRTWKEDKMYHYDISPNVNKFYSYNFLNGDLIELTPFPGEQRVNGLMACIGDYIYLGFGINNVYQSFNDLWRYSIINNTWEFVLTHSGMTSSISEPLVFAFENRLFFGGTNSNDNSNLFWEIDLNTFSLIPKSNLPINNVSDKKGVTLNSKGYFESFYLYEYDLLNDQWIVHEDIEGIGFVYPSTLESIFTNNGNIYRSVTTSAPYYSLLFKLNMSYL